MQGPRPAVRINCECTQCLCPPLWLLQCDYCQGSHFPKYQKHGFGRQARAQEDMCMHMAGTSFDLPDVFVTDQLSSGAFQVRFRIGVTHRLCLYCISPPIQRLFQGKQMAIQVMSCAAVGLARELQSSLPSSESRNQT